MNSLNGSQDAAVSAHGRKPLTARETWVLKFWAPCRLQAGSLWWLTEGHLPPRATGRPLRRDEPFLCPRPTLSQPRLGRPHKAWRWQNVSFVLFPISTCPISQMIQIRGASPFRRKTARSRPSEEAPGSLQVHTRAGPFCCPLRSPGVREGSRGWGGGVGQPARPGGDGGSCLQKGP